MTSPATALLIAWLMDPSPTQLVVVTRIELAFEVSVPISAPAMQTNFIVNLLFFILDLPDYFLCYNVIKSFLRKNVNIIPIITF